MWTRRGLFVMAVSQWMIWATVLFLLLTHGAQSSPSPPACPVPCLCQRGPLLNCSSTGLSLAPSRLPGSVTDLDLSHNLLNSLTHQRPSQGLQRLWLGNNSITHLSLCVERRGWRNRSRRRCVSWAPGLQLLSAERNQLEQLPKGLGGSEFLQVLQLSYNQISALRPGELSHCTHLRELHLQQNRITSLHPQALKDLPELRVLDLSFNLLTSIAPSSYLSLRNLKGLVDLRENKWRCDCSMRSLRRWMAYDRDRDRVQQTWRVVCASPSALSGRDLSHMEDDDLTCSTAETRTGLHREVTVKEGAEITLPCGSPQQDSTWWTPNGHVSVSRAGLLIRDITEQDTGLYVCVSGPGEVSVFDLHIRKTGENLMTRMKTRGTRSLRGEVEKQQLGSPQRDSQGTNLGSLGLQRTNQKTQSDLVLAVCLSVLITFLVAFILGALARPLLNTCWRKHHGERSSSPAHSVSSSTGQRPYDNNGYSDGEEPDGLERNMERRVTFSHPSQTSVAYYDTVASEKQDNLQGDVVVVQPGAMYENIQHQSEERDSFSDNSSQHDREDTQSGDKDISDVSLTEPQGGTATHPAHTRSMEFEPIPDLDETEDRRRRFSESSHSDQEGNTPHNNPWEPQSPQQVEDTLQRLDFPTVNPVELPQITISTGGIPGFSSEPFADWKPNMTDVNQMDPELWNDSGDSFEFAESIQGESARSSSKNLSGSIHHPPPSDALEQSDRSSSSSSIDSEPTEYIVNPETKGMGNVLHTHDSTLEPAIVNPYLGQDVSIDQPHYGEDLVRPYDSSHPSDIGYQVPPLSPIDTRINVSLPLVVQASQTALSDTTGIPPPSHSASSSSESEDETGDHKKDYEAKVPDFTTKDSSFRYPTDINVSLAPRKALNMNIDNSDSSTDTVEWRARAEESSRSIPEADLPPEAKWAGLDLGVPRLQKRLVVDVQPSQTAPPGIPRTPSLSDHSSSSSESEDEMKGHSVKLERQGNEAVVPDVTTKDLSFRYPTDIKASLAPRRALNINIDNSDSSTDTVEWRARAEESSRPIPEADLRPEARWAGLDLGVPRLQKRLIVEAVVPDVTTKDSSFRYPTDIKASLAPRRALNINIDNSDSSTDTVENRATIDYNSPTSEADLDPKARWAGLGLGVPRLQKRLVVQPPQTAPPDIPQTPPPSDSSSSSSESGDETRDHTVKLEREQDEAKIPDVTTKDSSFRYPTDINVSLAPRRALNISSINANTASNTNEVENRASVDYSSPTSEPVIEPETRWAGLGLGIPRFRKHQFLQPPQTAPTDIPQTPPPLDSSSSSSESEDETRDSTVKLEREELKVKHVTHSPADTHIPVSFAPRRALNIKFDNSASSTDEVEVRARAKDSRGARPGQGGLNVQWSEYEERGFVEETKPLAQLSLPKTSLLFSTLSEGGVKAGESPLHIPRNRSRLAVDIQPPQPAPPDVPGTPPPSPDGQEAAAGSSWRPSQDFISKVLQRKRVMGGFGHSPQSSISRRDEGERSATLMGLMGVPTPYHTAHQYQSVTSETITTTTTQSDENTSMQISGRDGADYSDLNMTLSSITTASKSLHFEINKGGSEA